MNIPAKSVHLCPNPEIICMLFLLCVPQHFLCSLCSQVHLLGPLLAIIELKLKTLENDCFQLQPVQACSGPVMTCFLHRLIKAFKSHWEIWTRETPGAVSVNGMANMY